MSINNTKDKDEIGTNLYNLKYLKYKILLSSKIKNENVLKIKEKILE
jgi:hypothetical protein